MRQLARICAVALIAVLPVCYAQTTHHAKKPAPKPPPTEQELLEFLRGQLLSYSPDDGINDNQEVSYNADVQVLTVVQPDGRCNIFLNALDANTLVWDIFDASDTMDTREKLLRLTVVAVSGKPGRACYDRHNKLDPTIPTNRVRFLFALYKTEDVPDFQEKIEKAFKALIADSGGNPEEKLF